MNKVSRIIVAGEWPEEYGRVCKEAKVALLLGKGVEGVSDTVMEEVDEFVMYWTGKWWQRKHLLYGDVMDGFQVPSLPSSVNSWTYHMHYYHIFLTDLFVI